MIGIRLPNGFGSIYKLSGSRRNPWIARKTIGWTEDAKQLYHTVGYYPDRKSAIAALVEYNKNPIGARGDTTLEDLYTEWKESAYQKIGTKTVETYTVAWKHLAGIKHMAFKDLRKTHLQKVIDQMSSEKGLSRSSCQKVKVLLGLLYKHALADDIVSKNYAELVEMPSADKVDKEPFNDEEIKALEALAASCEWTSTILILIYTGLRIGELLALLHSNIDIDAMVITGGAKTDAGKDRVIPVHPKIQGYLRAWYDKRGESLICRAGKPIKVSYYRKNLYYPAIEAAKTRKLSPHSTRHTFASLISRAGANTKSIQMLIGHSDYSTTANIYTHVDLEELKKAIALI